MFELIDIINHSGSRAVEKRNLPARQRNIKKRNGEKCRARETKRKRKGREREREKENVWKHFLASD